ncbi:MAG: glycosyltransferase, partial [Cryobacterium sp.]|nr:glycosyltransferase [Oligoflexia bacterium]
AALTPIVRHLRTPPRGVVFNMNTLLRECRSEVILYVDDDIIPTSTLVSAHLKNYSERNAVAVAGRVEQPSGDLPAKSIIEVGQFRRWTGKMIFRFNGFVRQPCVFAQGANMSFLREALLSVQGFDEGFIGNGYFFESEGTLRVANAFPGRMFFDPDASLQHLAAPRGGARIHDRSWHHAFYTHNAIRLFRRHCPPPIFVLLALKLFGMTLFKAAFRGSYLIAMRGTCYFFKGLTQNEKQISDGLKQYG